MIISTYVNDLEFLYSKLIKHPLFVIKKNELDRFNKIYNDIIHKQNDYSDFIDSMTLLTGFFNDGHTNIELPYTNSDKCLNIPCHWDENRLILSQDYNGAKSGSEIISINNTAIDEIISSMTERIPHENIYLVKSRMINYPYKNYHVFSEFNLSSLFRKKDKYNICFATKGSTITKSCLLENYTGFLDFNENNFVYYELVGDDIVLHLDSCICDEVYKSTLNKVADICNEIKAKSLILDLSKNMGGSSAVIDEFIKHVDIDEFRRYEMIDYSQGKPQYITRRGDIIKNNKVSKLFPLDIYCRVSHDTFSSARTFAVTLKDNGIAKIIGSPTGGKPNSFGMPKKFKTPNNKINFRVSQCLFLRPKKTEDGEIALFPID